MKRTIIKKEKPKTKDLLTSYRGKKLKTFQKVYKNTTVSEKKTFLGFLLNDNSKNREGFINYLLATEKLPLKEQIILILKSKNYLLLQSFINP